MDEEVKFLQGEKSDYDGLEAKEPLTFYWVTDENKLYLGETLINGAADVEKEIGTLGNLTTEVKDSIVNAINELVTKRGVLDELTTDAKETLVAAINEVKKGVTDSKVTVSESESGLGDGIAKKYDISQGGSVIGTINIPKDLVVKSGEIQNNPDEQHNEGKYLVLTLNNDTSDKIYIKVQDLVDAYTAKAEADMVQINISDSNEISASIVAASITEDKLSSDLSTKIDGAVQTIEEGTENGKIKVDEEEVAVHGLKNAAFMESTAFDATGKADEALTNAKVYVDEKLKWKAISPAE